MTAISVLDHFEAKAAKLIEQAKSKGYSNKKRLEFIAIAIEIRKTIVEVYKLMST